MKNGSGGSGHYGGDDKKSAGRHDRDDDRDDDRNRGHGRDRNDDRDRDDDHKHGRGHDRDDDRGGNHPPPNNGGPEIPEGAQLVGTVSDGNGLLVNIYATQVGSDVVFNVKVDAGKADLRGFFLDTDGNPNNDNVIQVGGKDNNMNGVGELFDVGFEIGTAGRGKDDIDHAQITVKNLSLDNLDGLDFGIRATSVGAQRCDSVKLTGEFDVAAPPPPPPGNDSFPDFKTSYSIDVESFTLYFATTTGDANGDGVYAVNIVGVEPWFGDDLDASLDPVLLYLRSDPHISAATPLLGIEIRGGGRSDYHATDGIPDIDGDEIPTTSGLPVPSGAVELTVNFPDVFLV